MRGMLRDGQQELHEESERVEALFGQQKDAEQEGVDLAVAAEQTAQYGLLDVAGRQQWFGQFAKEQFEDVGHVDDVVGFAEASATFQVGLAEWERLVISIQICDAIRV